MTDRSPLALARGYGSAHSGTGAWWWQRVSSVVLTMLTPWIIPFLARVPSLGRDELAAWIGQPINAIGLLSMLLIACGHTVLGLSVIIEDYVHGPWVKTSALITVRIVFLFLAIAALVATVRLMGAR